MRGEEPGHRAIRLARRSSRSNSSSRAPCRTPRGRSPRRRATARASARRSRRTRRNRRRRAARRAAPGARDRPRAASALGRGIEAAHRPVDQLQELVGRLVDAGAELVDQSGASSISRSKNISVSISSKARNLFQLSRTVTARSATGPPKPRRELVKCSAPPPLSSGANCFAQRVEISSLFRPCRPYRPHTRGGRPLIGI